MAPRRKSPERLDEYRRKRSFDETPEPSGEGGSAGEGARFVIQEHHATRLHWDFRLERDGVLVSWALPRGVPLDPGENHLAVHTEDHPLDYFDFEGEIPKGEYGGGTVKRWDAGTYEAEKWEERKVVVRLHGERVEGRYALFATGKGGERNWMIHRMDPPPAGREPMPSGVAPMKARLSKLPRNDEGWAYEVKWDGVRAIAYCHTGKVELQSRTGRDVTGSYPELAALAEAFEGAEAVLDGEIVALDADGRPSFQRLQRRMHVDRRNLTRRLRDEVPVEFVVFDLLYYDGELLLDLPYEERRSRLEALGLEGPHWRTPSYHRGDGAAMLELTRAQGLEGIVGKRLDSKYRPGRRGGEWIKVKNVRKQEVVIGGWLPGKGKRGGRIGALLCGYYDGEGDERRLRYAGKVGTGFSEAELDRLAALLGPLRRDDSPFEGRQPERAAIFAEPVLVAEVEFGEWTEAGTLRHPSYEGLRNDREPETVVREEPQPPPE